MYKNFFVPGLFSDADDLIYFAYSVIESGFVDTGNIYWILKRSDYLLCVELNAGGYNLLKRGDPDTLLEWPIIIDDSVEQSGVCVFTHSDHTDWHRYALDIFNELVDDYKSQNGAIDSFASFRSWVNSQAGSASGVPQRHKLYPHRYKVK